MKQVFCIFVMTELFTPENQEISMKSELYNSFLAKIEEKIPHKTEIAGILADILCIGKEAVYRRLRGEVPFSFHEAITISRQLGISLDSLDVIGSPISKPLKLKLIEYINPAESDFALMEEIITILKFFKNTPDAKGGEITNILPQPLYVGYEHIFKFYLFKWKYQSNSLSRVTPYKDIVIVDKLQKTQEENVKWAKCLHTEYIFDNQLFNHLVTNIKHFYYVGLITEEELLRIKQDLLRILDEIDNWTRTGIFRETGKKINIYISNVSIDTSYCYIYALDYQLTIIKSFLLNGVATTDSKVFEELTHLLQSMKSQSILITECNERERFNYLKKQHEIIENLSHL